MPLQGVNGQTLELLSSTIFSMDKDMFGTINYPPYSEVAHILDGHRNMRSFLIIKFFIIFLN